MLWATAGLDEFDGITKKFYKGAIGCVITFSTTDKASLEAVESWKAKVEAECPKVAMVLMQNKIDLADQASFTQQEAEAVATKTGLRLFRTSVKENLNVNEMFDALAADCVKLKRTTGVAEPSVGGTVKKTEGDGFNLGPEKEDEKRERKKKKLTCIV